MDRLTLAEQMMEQATLIQAALWLGDEALVQQALAQLLDVLEQLAAVTSEGQVQRVVSV